jgi:hypothetical protein
MKITAIQQTASNKKDVYEVSLISCTCPDYVFRQLAKNGKCKHIKALDRLNANLVFLEGVEALLPIVNKLLEVNQ